MTTIPPPYIPYIADPTTDTPQVVSADFVQRAIKAAFATQSIVGRKSWSVGADGTTLTPVVSALDHGAVAVDATGAVTETGVYAVTLTYFYHYANPSVAAHFQASIGNSTQPLVGITADGILAAGLTDAEDLAVAVTSIDRWLNGGVVLVTAAGEDAPPAGSSGLLVIVQLSSEG